MRFQKVDALGDIFQRKRHLVYKRRWNSIKEKGEVTNLYAKQFSPYMLLENWMHQTQLSPEKIPCGLRKF